MKKEKKVFYYPVRRFLISNPGKTIFLISLAMLICVSGLFFAREVRALTFEGQTDVPLTIVNFSEDQGGTAGAIGNRVILRGVRGVEDYDVANIGYVKSAIFGEAIGIWKCSNVVEGVCQDSSDIYLLDPNNTWDVGIGTDNPQAKFEVYDTGGSLAKIKTDGYIEVDGGIIPMTTGVGNIGTDTNRWGDIRMSGTLYDGGTTYYIDPNDTGTSAVFAGSITIGGDLTVSGASTNFRNAIKAVDGSGSLIDADLLDTKNLASASTADTVVLRDTSGDINTRLFRSEYDSTNATINYIMTQIDTASNNYIRPSTPTQLKTALGLVAGGSGDIWVEKAGDTMTGPLTMSGTSANIILGSNWLSGDGGDEGVFVDSTGNVGIGVASPAYELDVNGFVNAKSNYKVSDEGLVLRMNFNTETLKGTAGSEKVLDGSGYNNHGQNYGATATSTGGFNGSGALSFDGVDNYVDCGNDESLNITDAITVSAWIKYTDNAGWQVSISKGYDVTYAFKSSGGQRWDVFFVSAGRKYLSFGTLNNDVWYHLVGTFDGRYQKCYTNGILKGTYDLTSDTIVSDVSEHLVIGNVGGSFFNGLIDEVRIYNRALSADEIKALYLQRAETHNSYVSQRDVYVDSNGNVGIGVSPDTDYTLTVANGTDGAIKTFGKIEVSGITSGNTALDVGQGKISAGEMDPRYEIDEIVYATYAHSTTGLKEETIGKVELSQIRNPKSEILNKSKYSKSQIQNDYYQHTIDFDEAEVGSDLWLLREITAFGDDWNDLVVSLTPEGKANVWYEFIQEENKIIIYGDRLVKVSYRLVAPRFDWPERDTNLCNGTGKAPEGSAIFVR